MNDLIVPVHDRRQRKRILTLKNFGRFAIALAVVFAGLTIQSEMRRGPSDGNYGRLFGKQVARQDEVAKPKFDVVKEAPVGDQTAADPTLLQPGVKAQQYGIGVDLTPTPVPPPSTTTVTTQRPEPIGPGVTIVGGSDGVTIVKNGTQQRPVLSGGVFKPQQ